jgi:hypothetical protein
VCGRADALIVYERDDGLPIRLSCRASCHPARIEQALAAVDDVDVVEDPSPLSRPLEFESPELLRRQAQLLSIAADWLEERRRTDELRAA